jgi:thiamine transport system permease protein
VRSNRACWGLLIFIGFYLPFVVVLLGAFAEPWPRWAAFFSSPVFLRALAFSLAQAVVSAAGSLLVALPGAYFLGNYSFPGKRLVRSLLVIPFVLPGILVVLGLIVFYGRNGTLNGWLETLGAGFRFTGLYGWPGIILAHILYNFPLGVRAISESWEGLDPAYREASSVLGAHRWQTFCRVTLPLLLPAVTYSFLMAFVYSFLSFTVVLVLGGLRFRTFEVLIYTVLNKRLDFSAARMFAAAQFALLAGLLLITHRLSRSLRHGLQVVRHLPGLSWRQSKLGMLGFLNYLVLIGIFFGGPLAGILGRSFRERGLPDTPLTLANYRALLEPGFHYLAGKDFWIITGVSLLLALTAGLVCTALAYWGARRESSLSSDRWDLLAQAPLGVSFLTFTLGVYTLAGQWLPPLAQVFWAQVFLGFPLVYARLRLAREELGDELLEAAAVLGADPRRRWRDIEWPLLRPALGTGFAYATALALGDLSAVLVLGEGQVTTLPVAIYRLIGQYRFPQALALGTVFVLCATLLFLGIEVWARMDWRRKGATKDA